MQQQEGQEYDDEESGEEQQYDDEDDEDRDQSVAPKVAAVQQTAMNKSQNLNKSQGKEA
jgi:hypothetical protein